MRTKKEQPKYRPGDFVVVVHETFGWGRVKPGDIGVVRETSHSQYHGSEYRIRFSHTSSWAATDRDIRAATAAETRALLPQLLDPSAPMTSSTVATAALSMKTPAGIPFDDLQKLVRDMRDAGMPSARDFFNPAMVYDPRIDLVDSSGKPVTPDMDKPATRRRLPKHLKGLKEHGFIRVTKDTNYFKVGDIFEVQRIDHSDKTVKVYHSERGGSFWIGFDEVSTDIESGTVSFDSVILDEDKKQAILATIKQVDNHELIFTEWGFGDVLEKGKAISMLFYGPPGTGKTLMAQAIADKYGKKLKFVGSAEIESSEPGQAERNIKAFFDSADMNTVLLFDECDSLVYSREQVGSILAAQVNQLLSSLETFEGIVIFTTNRLGVLDEAFNRRLSLKLEFGMPSAAERVKIWQRMFPKKAPLAEDVDWERLASVELSGGYIKNVVLRAARMAAAEDIEKKHKKINMHHLVTALTDEAKSIVEFEDARKNNHTPRMMGGGVRRNVTRGMGTGK